MSAETITTALSSYTLPALPPIPDRSLRKVVFTHSSAFHEGNGEDCRGLDDYTRLAHLGDALLTGYITSFLQDEYPNLEVGASANLRSNLVKRETLSALSHHYHLPGQLQASKVDKVVLAISTKETCELFEAYLGGLFYTFQGRKPYAPARSSHTAGERPSTPDQYPTLAKQKQKTPGQALDELYAFLDEIYLPLSLKLFDENAQGRKRAINNSKGAVAALHAELDKRNLAMATYADELFFPDWITEEDRKGSKDMLFRSTCAVALEESGLGIKSEGVAETKKSARNIAAHEALKKLMEHWCGRIDTVQVQPDGVN